MGRFGRSGTLIEVRPGDLPKATPWANLSVNLQCRRAGCATAANLPWARACPENRPACRWLPVPTGSPSTRGRTSAHIPQGPTCVRNCSDLISRAIGRDREYNIEGYPSEAFPQDGRGWPRPDQVHAGARQMTIRRPPTMAGDVGIHAPRCSPKVTRSACKTAASALSLFIDADPHDAGRRRRDRAPIASSCTPAPMAARIATPPPSSRSSRIRPAACRRAGPPRPHAVGQGPGASTPGTISRSTTCRR